LASVCLRPFGTNTILGQKYNQPIKGQTQWDQEIQEDSDARGLTQPDRKPTGSTTTTERTNVKETHLGRLTKCCRKDKVLQNMKGPD
jgi:hypothetical protein